MLSTVKKTTTAAVQNNAVSRQVRCATRVGFWRKRRNLRNPLTRNKIPIMFKEDTRAQDHKMFMKHWMFELETWRAKFREMRMHKVTEYEVLNQSVPPGRKDAAVRAMRQHMLGVPLLDDSRITMKDNPYIKSSQNWMFATERLQSFGERGKLHWIMESQGKTLEEAKKIKADMRGKHRAARAQLKKGTSQKIRDYLMRGESSVHYDEINKLNTLSRDDGSIGTATETRPRKAWRYYEYDSDSRHKKVLAIPKDNLGTAGLNPMTDYGSVEVSSGERVSLPGSTVVMGSSKLPEDYAFSIKMGLI